MLDNLKLGQHYERFVFDQVNSGRFADPTEVVRAALRLLEEREEERQARLTELRRQIEDGLASGDAGPLDMNEIYEEVAASHNRR